MDAVLQQLKRQAHSSDDLTVLRQYIAALERVLATGDDDLKLFEVTGFTHKERIKFLCVAANIEGAKAQFEKIAKEQGYKMLWNHTFEGYAGPVDGMDQPLDLMVSNDTPLPLQHLTRWTYVIAINEVALNTLEEHY